MNHERMKAAVKSLGEQMPPSRVPSSKAVILSEKFALLLGRDGLARDRVGVIRSSYFSSMHNQRGKEPAVKRLLAARPRGLTAWHRCCGAETPA